MTSVVKRINEAHLLSLSLTRSLMTRGRFTSDQGYTRILWGDSNLTKKSYVSGGVIKMLLRPVTAAQAEPVGQ